MYKVQDYSNQVEPWISKAIALVQMATGGTAGVASLLEGIRGRSKGGGDYSIWRKQSDETGILCDLACTEGAYAVKHLHDPSVVSLHGITTAEQALIHRTRMSASPAWRLGGCNAARSGKLCITIDVVRSHNAFITAVARIALCESM
jgi:hypothetical protein